MFASACCEPWGAQPADDVVVRPSELKEDLHPQCTLCMRRSHTIFVRPPLAYCFLSGPTRSAKRLAHCGLRLEWWGGRGFSHALHDVCGGAAATWGGGMRGGHKCEHALLAASAKLRCSRTGCLQAARRGVSRADTFPRFLVLVGRAGLRSASHSGGGRREATRRMCFGCLGWASRPRPLPPLPPCGPHAQVLPSGHGQRLRHRSPMHLRMPSRQRPRRADLSGRVNGGGSAFVVRGGGHASMLAPRASNLVAPLGETCCASPPRFPCAPLSRWRMRCCRRRALAASTSSCARGRHRDHTYSIRGALGSCCLLADSELMSSCVALLLAVRCAAISRDL